MVTDAEARPWPGRAAAVGALVIFAVAALVASRDGVPRWEAEVLDGVNGLPDALRTGLVPIMQLGTFAAPLVVGAVVLALTRRARPAADVVIAGVAAYWLALAVKQLVGRARPGALLAGVEVRDLSADGPGFVSGHATVAFAIATALAPALPRGGRVVAFGLATIVAVARLHEGVHLPLDVLGGAALGVLCGLATTWALDRVDTAGDPR
jgi:undecaprenyl-diphosphatase